MWLPSHAVTEPRQKGSQCQEGGERETPRSTGMGLRGVRNPVRQSCQTKTSSVVPVHEEESQAQGV